MAISFFQRISRAVMGKSRVDDRTLDAVEEALVESDMGVDTTLKIIDNLEDRVARDKFMSFDELVGLLRDEISSLIDDGGPAFDFSKKPYVILVVGVNGVGKTTTIGKLAYLLSRQGKKVILGAADTFRAAAVDQLDIWAERAGVDIVKQAMGSDPASVAYDTVNAAVARGADVAIIDTAGRLQIDAELIEEIKKLRENVSPKEVLLVADAALGQEAVNVAKAFNEAVGMTGVVMTKLDGDARGGAALSIKAVSGAPIKFAGTGEKISDIEVFHADRMAQRILGMGDIVSLVEKAQENIDMQEAAKMAEKLRKAEFNLEDFLAQMRQMKKLGPLGGIMKMLPGLGGMGIEIGEKEESRMRRMEAIILSMTPAERRNPSIINARRRMRIAGGSGTQVRDVNTLLKQFEQMRKMMKMMKGEKGRRMMSSLMRRM